MRYEYCTAKVIYPAKIDDVLNEFGDKEWENYFVVMDAQGCVLFFRRTLLPKPDLAEINRRMMAR